MNRLKFSLVIIFLYSYFLICYTSDLTVIPSNRILNNNELLEYLREDIPGMEYVYLEKKAGNISRSLELLADYLKEHTAKRYYFDWNKFPEQFSFYETNYPKMWNNHLKLAQYQISTFSPETQWQLPFKDLKGQEVTAYELRHLARQQKSFDMALVYFYKNKDSVYLDYFIRQVADLNRAFTEGKYDDGGNAVYEVFRAGKRIHNWLFCYQTYLSSPGLDWEKQILLIKTFLHHGAQLYERTKRFRHGNHHTRGLVALFEISVLFPEFQDSDAWRKQALAGLEWHLQREVNDDGFQFERSVHYHKGDIENYLRVYNLAKRNEIVLSNFYQDQFYKLFDSLVKLAQPNRRLPVLQDDTDSIFREYNDIDDVMAAGSIIFQNNQFRYFTGDKIPAEYFWLFNQTEINSVKNLSPVKPIIGSIALEQTGYYVMRNGWDLDDCHMVISAGLSEKKPDHQHGEMLGITAYANNVEILPNYQVKYNHPDFPFYKSSWVKNVALVDSIPLGREWVANKGGSGFGKWANLPKPQVITWITEDDFDFFSGSHDSYDSLGIQYYRTVIFLKDGWWIVRDFFISREFHSYQQIWQGLYEKKSSLLVESFPETDSYFSIQQLEQSQYEIYMKRFASKGSVIFSLKDSGNVTFTTVLYPHKEHNNIDKDSQTSRLPSYGQWLLHSKDNDIKTIESDAKFVFQKIGQKFVFLDFTSVRFEDIQLTLPQPGSVFAQLESGQLTLWFLDYQGQKLKIQTDEFISMKLNDMIILKGTEMIFTPGDKLVLDWE